VALVLVLDMVGSTRTNQQTETQDFEQCSRGLQLQMKIRSCVAGKFKALRNENMGLCTMTVQSAQSHPSCIENFASGITSQSDVGS